MRRGDARACRSCSRRRCSRSWRSRATPRSATCSRTWRRSLACAASSAGPRAARRGRRPLRGRRRGTRGSATCSSGRAYLELGERRVRSGLRAPRQQALRMRRAMRDRRGIGLALRPRAGRVASAATTRAEEPIAEARDLFRRAGDRWGLVSALWRTPTSRSLAHDLDGAEVALLEARTVSTDRSSSSWIAHNVAPSPRSRLSGDDRPGARALLERGPRAIPRALGRAGRGGRSTGVCGACKRSRKERAKRRRLYHFLRRRPNGGDHE